MNVPSPFLASKSQRFCCLEGLLPTQGVHFLVSLYRKSVSSLQVSGCWRVGTTEGTPLRILDGKPLGTSVGFVDGPNDGIAVGVSVGALVGAFVGTSVGLYVVGALVGAFVGTSVGVSVGVSVGTSVGTFVGVFVRT